MGEIDVVSVAVTVPVSEVVTRVDAVEVGNTVLETVCAVCCRIVAVVLTHDKNVVRYSERGALRGSIEAEVWLQKVIHTRHSRKSCLACLGYRADELAQRRVIVHHHCSGQQQSR